MENGTAYKNGSTSERENQNPKENYLLPMKFFCKTLVCGINRKFSSFLKLNNPKLIGRITMNLYGKLFEIF